MHLILFPAKNYHVLYQFLILLVLVTYNFSTKIIPLKSLKYVGLQKTDSKSCSDK